MQLHALNEALNSIEGRKKQFHEADLGSHRSAKSTAVACSF